MGQEWTLLPRESILLPLESVLLLPEFQFRGFGCTCRFHQFRFLAAYGFLFLVRFPALLKSSFPLVARNRSILAMAFNGLAGLTFLEKVC